MKQQKTKEQRIKTEEKKIAKEFTKISEHIQDLEMVMWGINRSIEEIKTSLKELVEVKNEK